MKPDQELFYVIEREGKKDIWKKCGAMWSHSKGGFRFDIEALPTNFNGKLVSLPRKEDEESAEVVAEEIKEAVAV